MGAKVNFKVELSDKKWAIWYKLEKIFANLSWLSNKKPFEFRRVF
jgi:hypothetical protein